MENLPFLGFWRWLPHRLSRRQSLSTTTVLFRTTGRSNSTYFWNDSWVQTFHSFSLTLWWRPASCEKTHFPPSPLLWTGYRLISMSKRMAKVNFATKKAYFRTNRLIKQLFILHACAQAKILTFICESISIFLSPSLFFVISSFFANFIVFFAWNCGWPSF